MAVLEYAQSSPQRFRWWHWGIATLGGAVGGYVVSIGAYELIMPALARGMQVTIADVGEPFRQTMAFA
jgi:hypothetical protein